MTIDNEELPTLAHDRLLRALEEIQAELNRREGATFLDIESVPPSTECVMLLFREP